jgi:hypothetical protein
MYEIEKEKTMRRAAHGRRPIYPWSELAVGDSFFIPHMTQTGLSGSVANAQRRFGIKINTRVEVKDGTRGVRVYRTE